MKGAPSIAPMPILAPSPEVSPLMTGCLPHKGEIYRHSRTGEMIRVGPEIISLADYTRLRAMFGTRVPVQLEARIQGEEEFLDRLEEEKLNGLVQGKRGEERFWRRYDASNERLEQYEAELAALPSAQTLDITFLRDGRLVFSTSRDRVLDRWALVRGGLELLDDSTRSLLRGFETGELGFVGLTDDPDAIRARLGKADIVVERATLEDIVYLTGRTGPAGVDLHGAP